MANNNRIKVSGYAKRIFFNDNIEYRNFSPDLVGFQLTSEGGTTLFTNGNFSISVNLDPKPNVLFTQGTKSKFYTLDDIGGADISQKEIQKNLKVKLNIDLTNPLSYVWYGSTRELIRSSLINIEENWPAAIYVDNKIGSVTGNNITNYIYDISANLSTFNVSSNFFVNPYNIKYTLDAKYVATESTDNPLRNLTLNYGSYVIEHNGITKNIKGFSAATQTTNSEITLIVEGNPFPELTGIYIPQISFLADEVDASIPYFIKPNETEVEKFFSGLNDFQRTILNREIVPKYRAEIISSEYTDEGVLLTSVNSYDFPILEDGYNLNFFDSFYLSYLDELNKLGENLDETKTDTIVRKYTTEAINSFDTLPPEARNDITVDGEKATKLLRIYGVEFDYIKKYIDGIKFAHVVTYDKKNNVPDSLVKDLSFMLGIEPINFINDSSLSKLFLPSNGGGQFSGTSTNLTQSQIEIELYRRLILNIAWMWKSKGTRKAIEFLFRFIGAPESLVNFNEYVVLVDKPLDMEEIKRLLYLYTGEVNLDNIPYDRNGYPNPPINGELVINNFIDPETGELVENEFTEMYFQKAGGWYRETYGDNALTVLKGNNPHVGAITSGVTGYDGGSEYLRNFSRCFIPNFDNQPTVLITADTLTQNYFVNYNYGIFNGVPSATTEFYTTQLTYNVYTGLYQPIDDCLDVTYSIIETPLQNDGKTTLQQAYAEAASQYEAFLELIKQDGYLVYSPEWQVIKNNYELSLTNCLTEIETEDCDINQTLEICISEKPIETIEFSCSDLNLIECSPFIYWTNEDGIKVSFDEFGSCCKENKGNYVSYVNEQGRLTEYCSGKAPCGGKPVEYLEDGIVVFDIDTNIVETKNPPTSTNGFENNINNQTQIYQIGDGCYTINVVNQKAFEEFLTENGYTIEQLVSLIENGQSFTYGDAVYTSEQILNYFFRFSELDCAETIRQTVISSPECCAFYDFDYQVVEVDGKCFIVCINRETDSCLPNQQITETLVLNDTNTYADYTIPFIEPGLNAGLLELQNPIGTTQQYYSTQIYKECFDEASIVKWFIGGDSINSPTINSLFEDPDFMDPNNWEVYAIDEYGRISFTPATFESDFILDWNYSDTQLNDLYREIAETLGYTFGTFVFDSINNILVPYNGTNGNSYFSAAVDPSYFKCSDVNSVSVVFGSEVWSGFKLPEFPVNETTGEVIEDCSCKIDFSFDYMLKYNAEDLIKCTDNISCFPGIINENTLNNINCLNFVVFTNSLEESEELVGNFGTPPYVIGGETIGEVKPGGIAINTGPKEVIGELPLTPNNFIDLTNQEIWQNANVIEPPIECCNAIGGQVVPFSQWENINSLWVDSINQTYTDLSQNITNLEFLETLDFDYTQYIEVINNLTGVELSLSILPSDCFNFDLNLDDCNIDYSCYITTQNVCSLEIPLECGLWTLLSNKYEKLYDELIRNIKEFKLFFETDCERISKPKEQYDGSTKINKTTNESQKNANELEQNSKKITEEIINITNKITSLNEDNIVIQKALSDVNNPLDCSVYSDKIKDIDDFDYKSYCNNIVYGNNINDGTKQKEYEFCIAQKTKDNENLKVTYSSLLNYCNEKNTLTKQLEVAKFENNLVQIDYLEKQIIDTNNRINELTEQANSFISYDETTQKSLLLENDTQNTINRTAELLNTTPDKITDSSGDLTLTDAQKINLSIQLEKNKSEISNLETKKEDSNQLLQRDKNDTKELINNTNLVVDSIKDESQITTDDCDTLVSSNTGTTVTDCCDKTYYEILYNSIQNIEIYLKVVRDMVRKCHKNWTKELYDNYEQYELDNNNYFNNYMDDLKLNFKLFVDNNNTVVQSSIDTDLTYLPYTQSVNPIWEWNPSNGYSGIILEGTEQDITLIKESVFDNLSQNNISYSPELFEPNWNTFKFTIPECVCDDLRRLYPNKEFFFSIEVENYECNLCLLVDNIQINVTDCKTENLLSINDCMIPQLSCVIDNKKSWVYYDDGIIKETITPNGNCNSGSTSNYEIIKLGKEEERLWLDLEYRYTDYNVKHSDLIINVKNTTFSIDPAKAIECDVFNYWKNIDCDNCPTKCIEDSKVFEDTDDFIFQDCNTYIFEGQSTEHSVVFSGEVLSSGYTLSFDDIVTTGLTFSCSTYTNSLTQSVLSLKNKYYALTSDYIESLDATYYQLLEKGESLDNFYIQENNCGTDTIVINDNSSLNNLFGIITENYDGTISLFENYLYTGTTPYSGGVLSEVLSGTGVTAQTFNQKLGIDQECCESLNDLLNGEGSGGLGLGKNYQWDSTNCFCTWKPLNDCDKCKGDCEYCGTKKECVDGFATGDSYTVCINPLDYLDIQPSEINIKSVFDQLVQTNLIDVKSRQTISDYPLLRLFYELYLNASNCGKDLSGKFTYDTMFEFMDKIGDYWLDLMEQVVPATTIWEGCDNSGKIYRNTIFDNNKFKYKRYSTNFIDVTNNCPLSAQTDYSIGSETTYSLVEQKPIYPSNGEITDTKTDILNKEVEIALLKREIEKQNSILCALNLQDLTTPNIQETISNQEILITSLNDQLVVLNEELTTLQQNLVNLEKQYLKQQENFYLNFTSCSGITQSLVNAENNLSGFTQGTITYERQRNFIAGLRNKYFQCVRQSNTLISDYNTIFITQIYDSNEYEGNVIIYGDPDWEPCSISIDTPNPDCSDEPPYFENGPFYNKELIHNCNN